MGTLCRRRHQTGCSGRSEADQPLKVGRCCRWCLAALGLRRRHADAGDNLGGIEGFDDVVICAKLKACYPVLHLRTALKMMITIAPSSKREAVHQGQPICVWQTQIHQADIGFVCFQRGLKGTGPRKAEGAKPCFFKASDRIVRMAGSSSRIVTNGALMLRPDC